MKPKRPLLYISVRPFDLNGHRLAQKERHKATPIPQGDSSEYLSAASFSRSRPRLAPRELLQIVRVKLSGCPENSPRGAIGNISRAPC